MTQEEFREWLTAHLAAFPSLGEWLRKTPGSSDHWQTALENVSCESCHEATRALVRGDLNWTTQRGWIAQRDIIRDYARELDFGTDDRPVRVMQDGTEVFRCADCRDTGTVSIYFARTMRAVKKRLEEGRNTNPQRYLGEQLDDGIPGNEIRIGTVACTCDAGEPFRELDAPRHIETEDGKLYLKFRRECMVPVDEGWDVLVHHVANSEPKKPDNYTQSFNSFNQG